MTPVEPTDDEKMEDLLWAAYLGLCVLRTMCRKVKLAAGEQTADTIIKEIEQLRPDFPPRTALRPMGFSQ